MKLIGVTGGVGAGKSQVLGYIRDTYKARILLADEAANDFVVFVIATKNEERSF